MPHEINKEKMSLNDYIYKATHRLGAVLGKRPDAPGMAVQITVEVPAGGKVRVRGSIWRLGGGGEHESILEERGKG